MINTEILVTGKSYIIGDIHSGNSKSTSVSSVGESHVEIKYLDINNSPKHLIVDSYFEGRGYTGSITVDVSDGIIESVNNKITIK